MYDIFICNFLQNNSSCVIGIGKLNVNAKSASIAVIPNDNLSITLFTSIQNTKELITINISVGNRIIIKLPVDGITKFHLYLEKLPGAYCAVLISALFLNVSVIL